MRMRWLTASRRASCAPGERCRAPAPKGLEDPNCVPSVLGARPWVHTVLHLIPKVLGATD